MTMMRKMILVSVDTKDLNMFAIVAFEYAMGDRSTVAELDIITSVEGQHVW